MELFQLGVSKDPRYIPTKHNCNRPLYHLVGIILGKAILENIPLDCSLCRSVWKNILGIKPKLRDIKYQDEDLYKSLKFIKQNNIDGIFFENFAVDFKNKKYPLVEGGEEIIVTDENKVLYLLLRTEYEAYNGMIDAIDSLKEGFSQVIPVELISDLGPDELNFMLCGNPFINLKDWREHTEYSGEYSANHQVIIWFWEITFAFTQKMQRDLLWFVTGTSRVPVEGFSTLKTLRGDPALFKIISIQYFQGALPRAHTCFNRLDLPLYQSQIEMKTAIIYVLDNHAIGFGIE